MTSLCTVTCYDHHDRPVILDRPTIEKALELAPDRCPDPADTEREIWMKVGAHQLAKRLLGLLERQEEMV